MNLSTMTIVAIALGALCAVLLFVTILLLLLLRAQFTKLTFRHMGIAMLLVAALSRDVKLIKRLHKLDPKDLPEFMEDLREHLRSQPHLKPALPDDSVEDGEFILYLTMRGLCSGAGGERLLPELVNVLNLSSSVRRILLRRPEK